MVRYPFIFGFIDAIRKYASRNIPSDQQYYPIPKYYDQASHDILQLCFYRGV